MEYTHYGCAKRSVDWRSAREDLHARARARHMQRPMRLVPIGFSLLWLMLALMSLPGNVLAQTPLPLANWQYSTGEVLASYRGPVPEWRFTVGAGADIQPNFQGARRYELRPSGIIDVRYRDIAFLSDGEGIGVNLLRGRGFRAGIAISYDLGRNTHDDPRVRHLRNISPAPEPKVFVQYFLLPFVLTADLRKGIGGHEGVIGDVGAYVPLPVAEDTYLFVGPSLAMADGRYMQSYFGVGAAEAAISGLRAFSTRGGFESAVLGATLVHLMGEHWLLIGSSAAERLLGGAAASPIPETRTQLILNINVGYRF